MKKVLLLLLVSLALLSACDKEKEADDLSFDRPYYFDWNHVYLDSESSYDRLFYTKDSLLFESRWKLADKEYVTIDRFGTHNNMFAGVDPSNMTDTEVKELARQWVEELRKEKDRILYVSYLDRLENIEDKDYGMLWGFVPSSVSATVTGIEKKNASLFLTFGEYHKIGYSFCYYTSYYYMNGEKTKGEYVRVVKEIPRNDGTILKDSQGLVEFDL